MEDIALGYKQTKIGLIPEEWELLRIDELTKVETGKTPLRSNSVFWENGTINWATTTEVNDTYIISTNEKITLEAVEKLKMKVLPINTILMAMYGQGKTRGKVALLKIESTINQAFSAIKPNKNYSTNYVFSYLNKSYMKIRNLSNGGSQDNLNLDIVKSIKIPLPPIKEQEKIANILTTWDNTISKQVELIKAKEELKKGLMQKLLSGKVRFSEFNYEWEEVRFSKFLVEISKKSTIENEYKILSSTMKNMEIRDGRVDAKTNIGYKILEKNQLVLSPQNLWLGNINFNTKFEIGLVSPSYKIFNINTNILLVDFAKYIFKTNKMLFEYKTCSEVGASVVRRNLDLDSFYLIPIKLPSLQEQQKIAEVISNADEEIDLLNNELKEFKKQKKGLMQKLLTGEVRVKV